MPLEGRGASTRGRAGKFNKSKRGGGRKFTRGLRPVDADGVEKSMWAVCNNLHLDDDHKLIPHSLEMSKVAMTAKKTPRKSPLKSQKTTANQVHPPQPPPAKK